MDTVDYTVITAGLSVAGVAAALVSQGLLKAGPNVAGWASKKLAGFFR